MKDKIDSSFDNLSLASLKESVDAGSTDNYHPILDPKNYPFYQKVKRNLYIMEQLLIDDNNDTTRATIESAPVDDIEKANDKRSKSAGKGKNNHLQVNSINKARSKSAKSFRQRGAQHISSFSFSHIMKWSFKNNPNAENFRRQMLPFYLLKDDSGTQHPRYIEQSTLSQNLSESTSIDITIYLSRQIQDSIEKVNAYVLNDNLAMGMTGFQRHQSVMYNKKNTIKTGSKERIPINIKKFYLLNTAQRLIEEVVEEV